MKKVFLAIAVASVFTACNNSETATTEAPKDTTAVAPKDTTAAPKDTTAAAPKDTTAAPKDTTAAKK